MINQYSIVAWKILFHVPVSSSLLVGELKLVASLSDRYGDFEKKPLTSFGLVVGLSGTYDTRRAIDRN